jgi:hypothetical protein
MKKKWRKIKKKIYQKSRVKISLSAALSPLLFACAVALPPLCSPHRPPLAISKENIEELFIVFFNLPD